MKFWAWRVKLRPNRLNRHIGKPLCNIIRIAIRRKSRSRKKAFERPAKRMQFFPIRKSARCTTVTARRDWEVGDSIPDLTPAFSKNFRIFSAAFSDSRKYWAEDGGVDARNEAGVATICGATCR